MEQTFHSENCRLKDAMEPVVLKNKGFDSEAISKTVARSGIPLLTFSNKKNFYKKFFIKWVSKIQKRLIVTSLREL